MDLRFIAVLMAVAIVMDMLGRMAKKRAAERQSPPGEDWDMMKALAEASDLQQPVAREVPQARLDQVVGGFELRPEPTSSAAPDSVERQPVIDHVERKSALDAAKEKPVILDPVMRDRSPSPPVVRSADPLLVEHAPESDAPSSEFAAPAPLPQLPRAPAPQLPAPPSQRRFRAAHLEDRLGLGTLGGLRTAMAAREILGPPLALRSDDEGRFEGR